MSGVRWERLAGLGGLVFVGLIVGTFSVPSTPDIAVSDSTLGPAIDADRSGLALGVYLLGAAAIAFVWFAGGLHSRLRRAEGEWGGASVVALAGAVMFATLMLVSAAVTLALVAAAAENRNPIAIRALFELDNVMFITSGFALALFLLAAAVSIVRTHALAAWVGWSSALLGAAMLVGSLGVLSADDEGGPLGYLFFVTLMLSVLWVVPASISLLRGSASEAAPWRRPTPHAA